MAQNSAAFPQLNTYLAKYQNPKEADAMTKIQDELDETKIILVIENLWLHDKNTKLILLAQHDRGSVGARRKTGRPGVQVGGSERPVQGVLQNGAQN